MSLRQRAAAVLLGGIVATAIFACADAPALTPSDPLDTRISVSPASDTLAVGDSVQLQATSKSGSAASVSWSSSNNAVATVTSKGMVHAIAIGDAVITATSNAKGASTAQTYIHVVAAPTVPVSTVQISPDTTTVQVGGTSQLSVTLRDASGNVLTGRSVSWSSLSTGIATVSGSGVVTGVAAGQARVVALSEGKADTALAIVQTASPVPVATVVMTPATATINVGGTQQMSVVLRDANGNVLTGRSITYTSSNSGVAGINSSGLVTGVAVGTANVIATSEGKADTSAITVQLAPVASVVMTPSSATISVGATQQMSVVLRDANGNTLTGRSIAYASTNSGVASINGSGLVTGVAAGSASVIATSEGKADTSAITVQSVATAKVDTIFYDGFESGNLNNWTDGYDPTKHFVRSGSLAVAGTHYLEVDFAAGGDGGWLTHFFMPGYDSAYVRVYMRFSPDWQGGTKLLALRGSNINNQWSAFGAAGKCPTGSDFFATTITSEPDYNPGPIHFYSYYPNMPGTSTGTCWGDNGPLSNYTHNSSGLSRDSWHKIEFWVKLNQVGQANGIQTFWIDGVQWGSWSGMNFRSTTDLRLNSVMLSMTGSAPTARTLYVDEVLVTTAKP